MSRQWISILSRASFHLLSRHLAPLGKLTEKLYVAQIRAIYLQAPQVSQSGASLNIGFHLLSGFTSLYITPKESNGAVFSEDVLIIRVLYKNN
jgi:hypothetical protein